MNFSKRKYIIFKKGFPQEIELNSVYIENRYKKIRDWGVFKFQNIHVSEVIEYKKITCYIQDVFYDDFQCFCIGRKSLLIEKFYRYSNKKNLTEREYNPNNVYVPVDINLEKLIMSNGNSYITIV